MANPDTVVVEISLTATEEVMEVDEAADTEVVTEEVLQRQPMQQQLQML